MGIARRKLHHDPRHTTQGRALEVVEVPSRCDQVRSHSLDGMHEHATPRHRLRLSVRDNVSLDLREGPEPMHDVALGLLEVGAKVRVSALVPLSELPPQGGGRPRDLERYLEIHPEVGAQKVGFGEFGVG